MEREILELRRQVANAQASGSSPASQQRHLPPVLVTPKQEPGQGSPVGVYQTPSAMSGEHSMGSHEAVASLLDLRSGFDGSGYLNSSQLKRLEDVMLVPERVTELFHM